MHGHLFRFKYWRDALHDNSNKNSQSQIIHDGGGKAKKSRVHGMLATPSHAFGSFLRNPSRVNQ